MSIRKSRKTRKTGKTGKTGKTRKSKKAAQGTRKIRSKRSNKKLELKNNKMKLYVGNQLQTSKFAWVSVSDGYIYISRDNNRIYWVLNKIKPEDRPKMSFNDKKQTFKIGNIIRPKINSCCSFD